MYTLIHTQFVDGTVRSYKIILCSDIKAVFIPLLYLIKKYPAASGLYPILNLKIDIPLCYKQDWIILLDL